MGYINFVFFLNYMKCYLFLCKINLTEKYILFIVKPYLFKEKFM